MTIISNGLDNNIYVLTELIQDDIQYYIYYQTQNMEEVTADLNGQIRDFIVLFGVFIVVLVLVVTVTAVLIASGIIKPVRELYNATRKLRRETLPRGPGSTRGMKSRNWRTDLIIWPEICRG